MKKNKTHFILQILTLLSLLYLGACKQETESIKPVADSTNIVKWVAAPTAAYSAEQVFTDLAVQRDTLMAISIGSYWLLDVQGQPYKNYGKVSPSNSYYGRSIYQRNAFAPQNRLVAIQSQNQKVVTFYDSKYTLSCNCNEPVTLYTDYQSSYFLAKYPFMRDYMAFNTSKEIGVFNQKDEFLTSVVHKTNQQLVLLKFLVINQSIPRWTRYITTIDQNTVQEITLPEPSQPVRRMFSVNNNFLLSSATQSYLVRSDGSYKTIFTRPVKSYFMHQNQVYADFEDAVYVSADEGETWRVAQTIRPYKAAREFFTVENQLFFYKEDSLFKVKPQDFSYSPINNKGLEDKQITAVVPYQQNVFVATMNGLFIKDKKWVK